MLFKSIKTSLSTIIVSHYFPTTSGCQLSLGSDIIIIETYSKTDIELEKTFTQFLHKITIYIKKTIVN